MAHDHLDGFKKAARSCAFYSSLPLHSGDGYQFGGGAVVTIGEMSILFGEGEGAHLLAQEMAFRWNAGRRMTVPLTEEEAEERKLR